MEPLLVPLPDAPALFPAIVDSPVPLIPQTRARQANVEAGFAAGRVLIRADDSIPGGV